MHHGYEPTRINNLTQQSRWAVGALDEIHSTDPAAVDAMSAIAGLKSVIAHGVIPATTKVAIIDPLGGAVTGGQATMATMATTDYYYTPWDAMSGLLDWPPDTGHYSDMTDDELFDELLDLQLEGLPANEDFSPDMDDPFWTEFEPLAAELAWRARVDDSFADRLAQNASELVLIPIAADFADFEPTVVANMVIDVFERPQWQPNIDNNFRAYGAELLLTFLAGHPDVALETLADPVDDRGEVVELLEQMLRWPLLDQAVVAGFLDSAMAAPFAPPQRDDLLEAAGKALQDLVVLANGDSFPNGFRSEISPTLAKVVSQYLPFFVTSIELDINVFLKDFDLQDLGIKLGTHEEIVDLFGVLMRDPLSMIVLQQNILTLTALSSETGGPLDVKLEDIANYSLLLRQAAENEQLEEAMEAANDRRIANLAIDLTFGAIALITTALGPITAGGVGVPIDVIESSARAFAKWATTATDLGLDDVATITALLTIIGIAGAVIRSHDGEDGDEEDEEDEEALEKIDHASNLLQDIEESLASGAPIDEIEGKVRDLGRMVSEIDVDAEVLLDDRRVASPEYDVGAEADTEG